jgi:hypothetical protein
VLSTDDYRDAYSSSQASHRPTVLHVVKPRRFHAAVRATRKQVIRGWTEPSSKLAVVTPDEELCYRLGLTTTSMRRGRANAVTINPTAESRLLDEARHLLNRSAWPLIVDGSRGVEFLAGQEPDHVVQTVIGDRTVYMHSLMSRFLQRCYKLATSAHVEATLLDCCHGYRPKRSRFTALAHARRLIREGYHYVVEVDVRQFFPSIHFGLLDYTLRNLGWLGHRMRKLGLWFQMPVVLRRPNHPGRRAGRLPPWNRAEGHLLQGSVIAPTFANLVLTRVLDQPMLALKPSVELVRYADNLLLAGKSPHDCARALKLAEQQLRGADLELHPDKGIREPLDVRQRPLVWLGKTIHGDSIMTPDKYLSELIERIAAAGDDEERADTCYHLVAELHVDAHRRRRLDYAERELHRRNLDCALAFASIRAETERSGRVPEDPEPDDYAAHLDYRRAA